MERKWDINSVILFAIGLVAIVVSSGCAQDSTFKLPAEIKNQSNGTQQISPSPQPTLTPLPSPTVSASATPTPSSTPIACPCLIKWGVSQGFLNVMDGNNQPVEKPVVGGYVVIDTTPRFQRFDGDTRGGPCNAEHDSCGGRHCEDPRGPSIAYSGTSQAWNMNRNPFLIKVGPLTGGTHRVTAKPHSDLRDEHGFRVYTCEGTDASDYFEFSL
ncbi:MAG: hypothetical protein IT289_11255 [Oligoflexia bacterium]|nr:hypothetical protein [Oligoflexia bacterium]